MYDEFKKVQRILIITLFFGIILTFIFSAVTFSSIETYGASTEKYFKEYREKPELFNEKYHDYTYATDEYSFVADADYSGWKQVANAIKYSEEFENDIDQLLFHAKVVQSEAPRNSYLYKYQQNVIDTYSAVNEKVEVGINNTCGWAEYFGFFYNDLIIILCVMLQTVYIFSFDDELSN